MHRNSVNPSNTGNSYTIFSPYKMQACNNYPDLDNSNGRLWSTGRLQENSAWTLTTSETCTHFCRSPVSCPPSQTLRKWLKNATGSFQLRIICVWSKIIFWTVSERAMLLLFLPSRCYHCFYFREDNLTNVLKNCRWQIGWSIASYE